MPCGSDINVLPLAGVGDVQASGFRFLQPSLPAFPSETALADEGASALQKDVIG